MIWKFVCDNEKDGLERYETARAGSLFCYIKGNGGFKQPGHADYEPERFNWYIAPDDEDKNYRRAIAEGCADSIIEAKLEIHAALLTETNAILEAVNA